MSRERPDYDDANLVLKLYDLRRETVMRASRDAIAGKFWPKSYEDFIAITKPEHAHNAAYRQVASYWEMVYGIARHGIAHPEYLVENSGEGLYLFAKVHPHIARFRQEVNPTSFQNADWAASHTEAGKRIFAMFQKRVATMLGTK